MEGRAPSLTQWHSFHILHLPNQYCAIYLHCTKAGPAAQLNICPWNGRDL